MSTREPVPTPGQGLIVGDPDIETPGSKRQFHRKVRSGCTTCKKRRVKCDEGKPTCLRCRASGKECLGYAAIPIPKVFEFSKPVTGAAGGRSPDRNLDNDDASMSDSTGTTSQASLMFPNLQKRQRSLPDFSDPTAAISIFASPGGDFESAQEKYSHDFFRHWLALYTAPRAETVPDLWTVYFPKVGQDIPALKDAMTANGILGTALLRKASPAEYETARLSALEYVNSAIAYLVKHPQPPLVLVMVAWLFWELEMAQGYFQSSYMHVESAFKMARSLTGSTAEEQAVLDLLRDTFASDRHFQSLDKRFPFMLGAKTPPQRRMAASLPLFRRTAQEIVLAQLKLAFDDQDSPLSSSDKAVLLDSLRKLRKELEWMIARWSDRVDEEIHVDTNESLLSPFLEEVASGNYTVETLCIEFARAIPVIVSRISHDDLEMRQDLIDFLQVMSMHYTEPESQQTPVPVS